MNTIELILLDMDGTMFDTEKIWFEVCKKLLEDIGHPGPPELYYKASGTGGEIERRLFAELLGYTEAESAAFIEELYRRGTATLLTDPIPEKPGLHELMDHIHENNLRWTIVSSSPRYLIDRYLSINEVCPPDEPLVDVTMIKHSKPSPEPYLVAAKMCGVNPANCLVIEDSHTGVASALAAGMKVIMVPDINEPSEEEYRKTVAVVDTLSEVVPFIEALCI